MFGAGTKKHPRTIHDVVLASLVTPATRSDLQHLGSLGSRALWSRPLSCSLPTSFGVCEVVNTKEAHQEFSSLCALLLNASGMFGKPAVRVRRLCRVMAATDK